jgi:hypothetical protein
MIAAARSQTPASRDANRNAASNQPSAAVDATANAGGQDPRMTFISVRNSKYRSWITKKTSRAQAATLHFTGE